MKFAVIDLETTGDQPSDEIIQVGLVIIEQKRITDRYHTYVKPRRPIPDWITRLTGISDDTVRDAPGIGAVLAELMPKLAGTVLVAHNAAFDASFLQRACEWQGVAPFSGRIVDTVPLLRMLFPSLTSLQLSMASAQLGIRHERPHQADHDAEATAHLFLRCIDRFGELPLLTVQKIAQLFEQDSGDFAWFVRQMAEEKERFTVLDPDNGRYFRQLVLNVGDWDDEKPARENGQPMPDADSFESFYETVKRNLRERLAVFEEREAQEQMIREVEASFESNGHLLIEAGTGTGKTLAYLIPSLYYGIRENKKIVVSTHTINLQEQLRQRDIPLLQAIFPVPFRASVLKGRNHYLCLRKFEQKLQYGDFANGFDDKITAAQLIVWLSETKTGDDEEIPMHGRSQEFWQTVASDTDSCLNRACPWFKKCFYHRARHEANIADVVITNHSLLFTDVQAENRLLPSYKHLVVDEAHQFEEAASKHFGLELHYAALTNTLLWLYKDAKTGKLPQLSQHVQRVADEQSDRWKSVIDEIVARIVKIKEDWDKLSDFLYQFVSERGDGGDAGQYVVRVKPDTLPKQWELLLAIEENLYLDLTETCKRLDQLAVELADEADDYALSSLSTDLSGAGKQLTRHRDTLRFFMRMADPEYVYWIEASSFYKSKSVQLYCVPLDVSPLLREHFFEPKDSVIMTSATLTVDKSFQYSSGALGLDPFMETGKLKTSMLPSPFQYRKQALVLIPRDFPSIRGKADDSAFIAALTDSLAEVAAETKGRMLVLFTSYRMLKQVHGGLNEKLAPMGMAVLGQGINSLSRSQLTRMFRDRDGCVLLGTSSFWEGVDIPGEALSCLAIVRLPFQPPNHPLAEAKSERLRKNGQNPFMALSVPQAVIRFKQGFGRLVRSSQDRGVVIIYDTRVLETQYGKHFLYSLPGPKIEHLRATQLVSRIKSWMGGESS